MGHVSTLVGGAMNGLKIFHKRNKLLKKSKYTDDDDGDKLIKYMFNNVWYVSLRIFGKKFGIYILFFVGDIT